MDTIFISNLIFSGAHGVKASEKRHHQNFGIDIALSLDTQLAAHSDDIDDTVDYAPLRTKIQKIVHELSFNLIEKLADTIAREILRNPKVFSVTVTIKKLDLWGNGTPGVSITRTHDTL